MFEFKDFDYLSDGKIELPIDSELYKRGERQSCKYEWVKK